MKIYHKKRDVILEVPGECDEQDGTIPCPSPACQCEWCQKSCSVCGEQLNARGYFDSHLIGNDWFCYLCWNDYDDHLIADPYGICPPIPRG